MSSKPNFEKPYTSSVEDLVSQLEEDETQESVTERIGTVTLRNGKKAQIHLTLTTEEEDFLDLVR